MVGPLPGLLDFLAWIDKSGIRKAAVTNAPRCPDSWVPCNDLRAQ